MDYQFAVTHAEPLPEHVKEAIQEYSEYFERGLKHPVRVVWHFSGSPQKQVRCHVSTAGINFVCEGTGDNFEQAIDQAARRAERLLIKKKRRENS